MSKPKPPRSIAPDSGSRLRDRLYREIVPCLARGVVAATHAGDAGDLRETSTVTLTILFRLLFIAYGESRGLLPRDTSPRYREISLAALADALGAQAGTDQPALWTRVRTLFDTLAAGRPEWGVCRCESRLFTSDPCASPAGAAIGVLELPDTVVGPVLRGILVDDLTGGAVDFGALGVSLLGTIYEGLLESELAIAEANLTVDADGRYRPVGSAFAGIAVAQGSVYLRERSGARKARGSFYTKPFIVDHLIEEALEPALRDHLARLSTLDDVTAAARFFDFRVVDPAMGSGNFLVAAVDAIAAALSGFLAKRALPGIGDDVGVLRRRIAEVSIYGVDSDPMSVELCRLSLWIHTFVPGLPLPLLDHGLVCGNSLVGVATILEASAALGEARELLDLGVKRRDLGDIRGASEALDPLRAACDRLTASRVDAEVAPALAALPPVHFPVAFPEVFLRDRPGFDVILGNPPWEEVTLERDRFWGRHVPGAQRGRSGLDRGRAIRSAEERRPDLARAYERELAETRVMREVLLRAGYPGMGTGDPDLYKAFVWRFWSLVAPEGRIGVVLPRVVFLSKGAAEFRLELLRRGEIQDVTFLQNRGGWVFEDVHAQETIALTTLRRASTPAATVPLRGPYATLEQFLRRSPADRIVCTKAEVQSWTDTAALPMLPSHESGSIFAQLRRAPRLDLQRPDGWRARPYAECHATNDRVERGGFIDVTGVSPAPGSWPVFKGESFAMWEPDTGVYCGHADPRVAVPALTRRRAAGLRRPGSPWYELRNRRLGDHPCESPRIAFRDMTKETNSRTLLAALVPGRVVLSNTAPFFLWPRGDEADVAYLLGVLCSRPLDWYARRFTDMHLSFHVLNAFPVPRPPRSSAAWRRVVAIAGRLACADARFAEFAAAISVPHGALAVDEKADLIQELDAVVAHLYGLDAEQLRHIFATFHEGWGFEEDLRATLRHHEAWKRKRQ